MKLTKTVIVLTIILLLIYEAWTLINGQPQDTLSEGIWSFSSDYPYVPFFAGILCGHWFWIPSKKKENRIEK